MNIAEITEENKYYTPEIEEFHVGFLFETYDSRSGRWRLNSVHNMYDYQTVFHLGLEKNRNGRVVNSNYIRVKYLDKKDIESLGFSEGKLLNTYFKKVDGKVYILWWNKLNPKILSINITIESNWQTIDGLIGSFQIFRGFIKNKSELERLLKQLEIQ